MSVVNSQDQNSIHTAITLTFHSLSPPALLHIPRFSGLLGIMLLPPHLNFTSFVSLFSSTDASKSPGASTSGKCFFSSPNHNVSIRRHRGDLELTTSTTMELASELVQMDLPVLNSDANHPSSIFATRKVCYFEYKAFESSMSTRASMNCSFRVLKAPCCSWVHLNISSFLTRRSFRG